MTLHALCIGVNRYGAGMDLSGCVNDANDWAEELTAHGFAAETLLDAAATRLAILDRLSATLQNAGRSDTVIVTYSGHGTWVPDLSGDEADHRDEAICPVDIVATGRVITDDELHDAFAERHPGTKVVFVSDSCHSGTVSRFADLLIPKETARRARFMPPTTFLDVVTADRVARLATVPTAAPRFPALLLSGCADPEVSYDAWFGNRPNGAFTRVALDALRLLSKTPQGPTFKDWHALIRKRLPSVDYPQTPGLYGTATQKAWRVFG